LKPPEKNQTHVIRAKVQDDVGTIFVNHVMARGCCYGVGNVTLGTYNFTPFREGLGIDPDLVISCRLRLDAIAVRELRDAMNWIIAKMEEKPSETNDILEPYAADVAGAPN
jgi:hypothetical protein